MTLDLETAFRKAAFNIGVDIQNELKIASPVKTGRLRNSIKVRIENDEIVIFMVDYAKFLEFGTPPHIIRPKQRQSLKWKKQGSKPIFAKNVQHPGTAPQPFIRPTLKAKLGKIFMKHITRELGD